MGQSVSKAKTNVVFPLPQKPEKKQNVDHLISCVSPCGILGSMAHKRHNKHIETLTNTHTPSQGKGQSLIMSSTAPLSLGQRI